MHWLAGVVGALLGAIVGLADRALLGAAIGFVLAWQGVRLAQLHARVQRLERRDPPQDEARERPRREPARPPVAEAAAPAPPVASSGTEPPRMAEPVARSASASPGVTQANGSHGWSAAAAAAGTDPAARILARIKRWLFEGNVPVKLGSLVLFVGVAAALRHAVDRGLLSIPIELRLTAIAAAALLMLVWGWRRRSRQPAFGLSLQGTALGVLLLTVFAAFRLYGLLPPTAAFALVVVLVVGAALLAVLQSAMALAVIGFIGGYLAPVLISSGGGDHVVLFAYYAVLNAAVFLVAWVRPWRALNLVGFGFSFGVMAVWGWHYYRPQNFASVEPFLVLFTLFYIAIPVLYALRQAAHRRGVVDGTLIFGTPLLAAPMQVGLLQGRPMALAYSALALAVLYALLALWLIRRRGLRLLGESHAVLGVAFATLAVPLALSMRWTSAAWALEGAALVWLGLRQQRLLPQMGGWLLQLLAALAYAGSLLDGAWSVRDGEPWLFNGHGLGLLMMALAGFAVSWLHDRSPSRRRLLVWPPFLAAVLWWSVAGWREIGERLSGVDALAGHVLFVALSVVLALVLRSRLNWPRAGWWVTLAMLPAPALALASWQPGWGMLRVPAAAAWLALFAAWVWALAALREPRQRGLAAIHVGGLWLLAAALAGGLVDLAGDAQAWALGEGWQITLAALPLAVLLIGAWRAPARFGWPLAGSFGDYRRVWLASAGVATGLHYLVSLGSAGSAAPLPFLALLNPLELYQLGLLLATLPLLTAAGSRDELGQALRVVWLLAAFLFLSFAGLRGVHHFSGVAWSPMIFRDATAQATLTLLWSLAGVTAWVFGSRLQRWPLWLGGAVVMVLVLAKLIVVDRQHMGDLAGIVSFMTVGGLLVLVGRIAPTPPRLGGDRP